MSLDRPAPLCARQGVIVRCATDADIPAVQRIFVAVYGRSYPHRHFYDSTWLKRAIYGGDQEILVAEDEQDGTILGTASVVLDVGSHADLLGEFGRLAVHPHARGRGVGTLLMEGRLAAVEQRLHVALVENRVTHPYSQRISHAHGFVPVGLLPLKHRFEARESVALFARHFGNGLRLRANHPRVIPEAYPLCGLALENVGLDVDAIVDDTAPAYVRDDCFETHALQADNMPRLMRIERGRIRHREIFGPMRLQYGFFKLTARRATYLVARERDGSHAGALAGAVGYVRDDHELTLRIFELISPDDRPIRFLLELLLARCRGEWGTAYVEVDVSAHAPRMQRTLLELGFQPAAYVPAMVFHEVERLDVVRMVRLLVPPELGPTVWTPGTAAVAEIVLRNFRRQAVLPRLREALVGIPMLAGLSPEQTLCVAQASSIVHVPEGDALFSAGDPTDRMFVLIDGEASVRMNGEAVGHVGPGEALGEVAFLLGQAHRADAYADAPLTAAVITSETFEELIRRRPDVGLGLFRNLALGLGRKLRRADARLTRA